MHRMAFFEILPYASKGYVPRPDTAAEMVLTDPGCQIASQAALGAIEHRRPAAVLVNGNDAVHVFQAVHQIAWTERSYKSRWDSAKTLHHSEGSLTYSGASIPVFGFPQRSRSSHNAYVEVDQMGERIAEVVRPSHLPPSGRA